MEDLFIYKVSEEEKERVWRFVKNIVDDNTKSYLSKRNQFDDDKKEMDHFVGKLGEIATHFYYTQTLKQESIDVDFTKHAKKQHDPDLIVNNHYKIHVKTQQTESVDRFSMSWAVQNDFYLIKNPTINDIYSLCIYDGEYIFIKKLLISTNAVYDDPRLSKFQDGKKFIYWEDIFDNENFNILQCKDTVNL